MNSKIIFQQNYVWFIKINLFDYVGKKVNWYQ